MAADRDASFSAFVAARGPALLRLGYLLTGDPREAEDLTQTVLTRTYAAWPRLRATEAADGYVRVAMARAAVSWRRRRRELPTPNPPDRTAAVLDDHVERDEMWRRLGRLPPRQRAVLVLRYYEDLSEAEIADALKCSRGTVKSQASKALATLRRHYTDTTPSGARSQGERPVGTTDRPRLQPHGGAGARPDDEADR